MNQEISEAIQHSIVPGDCADLYYPGVENTKKSCFPTYIENRYNQGLPSLTFGSSSTILFNPDQGLGDIVLTLALPDGHASYASVGLSTGWGYQMIESVGLRIAGSSYYTFTGEQLMLAVLADCEDSGKRNTILNLGGQSLLPADFASSVKRTAYVYLKMPFNSVSAQEKPLPLPTDLLTQPVQIVIKLKPASAVFYNPSGVALPSALDSAVANFRQVHMMDGGNLLARREDMNVKALSYPLRYFQNTTFSVTQAVGNVATPVQLNLTGFRQGSLKSIDMWVVKASDVGTGSINPLNWLAPEEIELKINGLVYYATQKQASQMWSLIERKTAAVADVTNLSGAVGAIAPSPSTLVWTFIPFAQHTEQLADGESENVLALGVPLQNSVVNVSVKLPEGAATGDYVFNFSYNYASTLMFSRGSCEYVF